MDISLLNFLAILNVFVYILISLFSKNQNTLYITYVLLSFPLLSIHVFYVINGFILITFIFFIFFQEKKTISYQFDDPYNFIVLLFISSIVIGIFLSGNSLDRESIKYFLEIISLIFYSKVLLQKCLVDPSFIEKSLLYIKSIFYFSIIFLITQFIIGNEFTLSRTMNPNIISGSGLRYQSFLSDPQVYAQYLGVISFVSFISIQKKISIHSYIIFIIAMFAIFTTGARAGFTGVALGLLTIIIFSKPIYKLIIFLICTLTIYIGSLFKNEFSIFNRYDTIQDSYDFRYSIWKDAIDIFYANPFFGIGIGNYSKYVSIHNPDQFWIIDNDYQYFDHPESGYLKFLTEFGLTGTICLGLIFLFALIKSFKSFVLTKDQNYIFFISSLICWMAGFYTTFSFGDIRISLLLVTVLILMKGYDFQLNKDKVKLVLLK
jgi:O-antigen ligase